MAQNWNGMNGIYNIEIKLIYSILIFSNKYNEESDFNIELPFWAYSFAKIGFEEISDDPLLRIGIGWFPVIIDSSPSKLF